MYENDTAIETSEQKLLHLCVEEQKLRKKIERESRLADHFGMCEQTDIQRLVSKLEIMVEKKDRLRERLREVTEGHTPILSFQG